MKLLTGKVGTGKTTYLINIAKKYAGLGEKVILITPEQYSFFYESQLLDIMNKKASINIEVLPFARMPNRVFLNTKYENQVYIDDIGRKIILEDVIANLDLKIIGKDKKQINEISKIIKQIKNNNINLDKIYEAFQDDEDIQDKNEILNLKLEDIKTIYAAYEEQIEEKYIDSADKMKNLSQVIGDSEYFKNAIVIIDEFVAFTYYEYEVLDNIFSVAKEIYLSLDIDRKEITSEFDILKRGKETLPKILKVADKNNVKVEEIFFETNKKHSKEIESFANLLLYPDKNNDEFNNVNIREFKTIEDEVSFIAQDILKNIKDSKKDKKLKFSNFHIINNNISETASIIEHVFNKYNIPYNLSQEKNLMSNILVQYIYFLLKVTDKMYIQDVFELLKLDILDFTKEEIYLLETYVRKWDIDSYKWNLEWKYDKNNKEYNKIIEIKNRFLKYINEFKHEVDKNNFLKLEVLKKLEQNSNISNSNINNKINSNVNSEIKNKNEKENKKQNEKQYHVGELLKTIYLHLEEKEIIKNILETVSEDEMLKKEYMAVLNVINEVLDLIHLIYSEENMSISNVIEVFKSAIENIKFQNIPHKLNAVQIDNLENTKTDVEIIYLMNANEGIIPQISSAKGIINDDEKITLKAYGLNNVKTDMESIYEQDEKIYLALMSAKNQVNISYNITDTEGEGKRASFFIKSITNKAKNLKIQHLSDKDIKDEILDLSLESKTSLIDKSINKYYEYIKEIEIENKEKEIISYIRKKEPSFRIYEKAILNRNIEKPLKKEITNHIYKRKLNTSISRLEEYSKCPFAYHIKYVLRLKEKQNFKIENYETGNFIHDVFEYVINQVFEKNIPIYELPHIASIVDLMQIEDKQEKEKVLDIINQILKLTDEAIEYNIKEKEEYQILILNNKFRTLSDKLFKIIKTAVIYLINTIRLSNFKVEENEYSFNIKIDGMSLNIENISLIESENENKAENKSEIKKERNQEKESLKDILVEIYGKIDRLDIAEDISGKNYFRIIDYKSSTHSLDINKIAGGLQLQLPVYARSIKDSINMNLAAMLYFPAVDPLTNIGNRESIEADAKRLEKRYEMSGLVLDNFDVVSNLDKSLREPSAKSAILPISTKKDGDLSKAKNILVSQEDIDKMLDEINEIVLNIADKITKGQIGILPYKYKKDVGCKFCPYKNICAFDSKLNNYRRIKEIDKK